MLSADRLGMRVSAFRLVVVTGYRFSSEAYKCRRTSDGCDVNGSSSGDHVGERH